MEKDSKKNNSKVSKQKVVGGFIAVLAIIGIAVYQIIDKVNTDLTSALWQDFVLIGVAILLFIRIFVSYQKEKSQ